MYCLTSLLYVLDTQHLNACDVCTALVENAIIALQGCAVCIHAHVAHNAICLEELFQLLLLQHVCLPALLMLCADASYKQTPYISYLMLKV